jgi:uncharacterized protein (DUF885 family)
VRRQNIKAFGCAVVACAGLASSIDVAAQAVDPAATRQVQALFDDSWEASMRRYPEWATYVGDNRYGDKLFEATREGEAADYARARRELAAAKAIARDRLAPADQVSLDIFIYEFEGKLRRERFVGFRRLSLGSLGGFQSSLAELLRASPVATRRDAEQILARLAAYPRRLDQELAFLREGMSLGWVPPRTILDRVLAQLDLQLSAAPDKGPFFEPFGRLGSDIPEAERAALQARARRTIADDVLPAVRRLRAFVADEYLPKAPASGALAGYPDGAAVYAEQVREATTTDLAPAQIHAIGLREVERLRREMDAVRREVGYAGDFAAFVRYLNTDPKFFVADGEALIDGYRAIAKKIDPELPKLFAVLPRAPYGVRAMPADASEDAAAYYSGPALDGSRAGWFNASAKAFRKRPIWSMETLVAHEAVPGHHLQIARAIELGDLPKFRRASGYNAYGEGWGLYAETLGFDLGLYRDPYSRFGHLQAQAFRAARLVVDTGLHAMGWSRQRAIDYMVERTGQDEPYVTSEVDRYLSWPGQALGYMIGELKIIELRDRAKSRLGERFDIRQFHGVVLDQGSVPLAVLERAVDDWIARGGVRAP